MQNDTPAQILVKRVINETMAAINSQNTNEARHHAMRGQTAYDQLMDPTSELGQFEIGDMPGALEEAWDHTCALAAAEKKAVKDGTTAEQRGNRLERMQKQEATKRARTRAGEHLREVLAGSGHSEAEIQVRLHRLDESFRLGHYSEEVAEEMVRMTDEEVETEIRDGRWEQEKAAEERRTDYAKARAQAETEMSIQYEKDLQDHLQDNVPEEECGVCEGMKPDESEASSPAGWEASEPDDTPPHGSERFKGAIGALDAGHALCIGCIGKAENPVPLFKENIGQYRQTCASCGAVISEGQPGWPELFDGPPKAATEAQLRAARAEYATELGVGNPDDGFAMAFGEWAKFLREAIATGGVKTDDLGQWIEYGAGARNVREAIVKTWCRQNDAPLPGMTSLLERQLAATKRNVPEGYCEISWIDRTTGEPTPDENPSIGTVRCKFQRYVDGYPDGVTRSTEYRICAVHAARMNEPNMELWEWATPPISNLALDESIEPIVPYPGGDIPVEEWKEVNTRVNVEGVNLTDRSHQLFLAYARDAGNWSGSPLVGGNVGTTKADQGNLTHLKQALLLTTHEEHEPGQPKCSWIHFTELGRAYAKANGIDLDWTVRS